MLIGIADVDAFVPKNSPIDQHASKETTSVYTGVRIFPMLPEELSTGATRFSKTRTNSVRNRVHGICCWHSQFERCLSGDRSQQGTACLQRSRRMA